MIDHFKTLIERYITAKDQNRPHLMADTFLDNAVLKMQVQSDNIDFPNQVESCEAITETLVRNFSQRFENVYTYCVTEKIEVQETRLQCPWFVVMTGREDGDIRFGHGLYTWSFEKQKVSTLSIDIDEMHIMDKKHQQKIYSWVNTLSYPWCSQKDFLAGLETIKNNN